MGLILCTGGNGNVGQRNYQLHFGKLLTVERDGDLASLYQWQQEKKRTVHYFVL